MADNTEERERFDLSATQSALSIPTGATRAFAALPDGYEIHPLEFLQDAPNYARASVEATELAGFMDYVEKFRDSRSIIFCDAAVGRFDRNPITLVSLITCHRGSPSLSTIWLGVRPCSTSARTFLRRRWTCALFGLPRVFLYIDTLASIRPVSRLYLMISEDTPRCTRVTRPSASASSIRARSPGVITSDMEGVHQRLLQAGADLLSCAALRRFAGAWRKRDRQGERVVEWHVDNQAVTPDGQFRARHCGCVVRHVSDPRFSPVCLRERSR